MERQTQTSYTKDEKVVVRALRSSWFEELEEIGDAYEVTKRKPRIEIKLPFEIGITVYQLAKLRMLEFYYDFLDVFINRRDFELIQKVTNSNYLTISGESTEAIVHPELRTQFEACRKEWLAWNKWSGGTPGLFKFEFQGDRAIALCSKAYYVDCRSGGQKTSAKRMSKRHIDLTWRRYNATLEGMLNGAENRGFRMVRDCGSVCKAVTMKIYHQEKLGLSAYYAKRRVLPDGIHTEPLEYAVLNA